MICVRGYVRVPRPAGASRVRSPVCDRDGVRIPKLTTLKTKKYHKKSLVQHHIIVEL